MKNEKIISVSLLSWLIILLFGPYFNLSVINAPVRVDHLFSPFLFTMSGIILLKKRSLIREIRVLFWWCLFIFNSVFSTFYALKNPENYIAATALIAALDNHLRILTIFVFSAWFLSYKEFNLEKLIRPVIIAGVLLIVLAFFQSVKAIKSFHLVAAWVTKSFYSGRSERGVSLAGLQLGLRSTSSFYQPGNFALFCSIMLSFVFFAGERLFKNKKTILLLVFTYTLGQYFSGSKGTYVAFFVLTAAAVLLKQYKKLICLWGSLLLVVMISLLLAPTVSQGYWYDIGHINPITLYNRILGPRFGMIVRVVKKSSEEKFMPLTDKSLNLTDNQKEVSKIEIKKRMKPESQITFDQSAGYMHKAIENFRKNKIIGVGYVSNVDYGDSMIIHLMTRGGIIGIIIFACFILSMGIIILRKYLVGNNIFFREYYIAWFSCLMIFSIGGIAFPTFIQDRSGDLFWWLGSILICSKKIVSSPATGDAEKY